MHLRMYTTVINCSWPAPRKLSERVLHKIQLLFLSVDYYFNSLLHEFQLLFLLSTTILRKFLEIFYFKVLFEFNYYFKDSSQTNYCDEGEKIVDFQKILFGHYSYLKEYYRLYGIRKVWLKRRKIFLLFTISALILYAIYLQSFVL